MDRFERNLTRYYLERVLDMKQSREDIDKLINGYLYKEKDRYIPLTEYFRLIGGSNGDIKPHDGKLLKNKVLPLPFADGDYWVQTGRLPVPEGLQQHSKRKSAEVVFTYSFVLNEDESVLLIKSFQFEDEIQYYALKIDIQEEKLFYREHFLLAYLPELLPYIHEEALAPWIYAIKNGLFEQAVRLSTRYAARSASFSEISVIKQLLLCNTPDGQDIEIKRQGKKILNIKAGQTKLTIQLLESKIKIVKNVYRTHSAAKFDPDKKIDAYILKATEPGETGRDNIHYVFISDLQRGIANYLAANEEPGGGKDGQEIRIPFSALFSKKNGEYVLEQQTTDRKWDFKYTNLYEVNLFDLPTRKRMKAKK